MSSGERRVAIAPFTHPVTGQVITQVVYGGWTVHVDGVAVTVPRQETAGKTVGDLDLCLREAYAAAGVPRPYRRAAGEAGSTELLNETLQVAARLAGQWATRSVDVYRCTSEAWESTGMAAPYAQLIRVLWAALPEQTTLSDYAAGADRAQIVELYERAIARLGGRPGQRGAA